MKLQSVFLREPAGLGIKDCRLVLTVVGKLIVYRVRLARDHDSRKKSLEINLCVENGN